MIIGGIIAVLLVIFVIAIYNRIKKLAVNVDSAFADLDAFLMKRVDELDNLIQTARVATDKEMEFMDNVVGLRSGIIDAHNMEDKIKAHNNLTRQMPEVMRSFENYPEFKANQNYLDIQRSISNIEEQIQAARRNFNSHTAKYNKSIATFPSNMLAGAFGFKSKPMFEAPSEKRENVDVKGLFSR